MRRKLAYLFLTALSLGAAAVSARAQEDKDSLVTLVSAKSAQLIERNGESFRKVTGPARFLHNNTYLLCDSALWNVTTNVIDAIGHVQIIQDRTRLSSGSLQYVVDDDLAKFRGGLVQLEDKDKNTLRTRYLDYNTKDSVAIFQNGASMRDKDGQIIESLYGSYDSKARLFVFNDQVNMYMDTTFVKTSRLEYRSDINTAYFGYATDMWQDDNMLSANDGWYDRDRELFFFRRNVHLLTKDQETWSDTLYYHRKLNDVELLGQVEVMDTTRNVFALAGRVEYTDSLSRVKMTVTPAVMSIEEDEKTAQKDTVWFGADTIVYRGIKRHLVDSLWKVDADRRLKDLAGDPVTEYRRKAAEAAAKAAAEAEKNNPNAAGRDRGPEGAPVGKKDAPVGKKNEGLKPSEGAPAPTGGTEPPADTTAAKIPNPLDSLTTNPKPPVDTVPAPPDTSQLSFIWATSRVKLFRRDMQMSCDSLVYYDLDSLVRLYRDPLVFSDGNRQYAADSIYLVIKDRKADRARLMSNAFITTKEDTVCYDQIKGAEMMAYFDTTRTLRRFDALGGATALFFLTENDALATVNKVESKMLYATFEKGNLDKIYYFDNPKNDAYPVVQLPAEERYMKGFRWEPERQPKGGFDITPLVPRTSQRTSYLARPHAEFKETDIYFPGHIKKIYKDIAYRDSMAVVKARQPKEKPAPPKPEDAVTTPVDTTAAPVDSIATPPALSETDKALLGELDSLAVAPPSLDSLKKMAPMDSLQLTTPLDSLATTPEVEEDTKDTETEQAAPKPEPSAKDLEKARKAEDKAARDAEKARIAAEKKAERDAKQAEQDRKYQEKQEAKRQKALEKERKKKLRALKKLEKKAQKERRIFERYLEKERIRAEEQAVREKEKAAREAEKAARKAERQEGAKEEAVRDSSSKKGLSSKSR